MDRQLAKAPREVLKRYEKWKDIARLSGPPGIRLIAGFHDEALAGKWKGSRSSRLGDDSTGGRFCVVRERADWSHSCQDEHTCSPRRW